MAHLRTYWVGEVLKSEPDVFPNTKPHPKTPQGTTPPEAPVVQKETLQEFLARGGSITRIAPYDLREDGEVERDNSRGIFRSAWYSVRTLKGELIQGDKARVLLVVRGAQGTSLEELEGRLPKMPLETIRGWLHNLMADGEIYAADGLYFPKLR